jgi:uncharacterized protein (DUF2249 family)
MNCGSETGLAGYVFDARGISKRFRHSAIFGAIEALDDGETMRFINDHDPLPLLAQLQQRYGNQIVIEYVERGAPVVIDFHVRLGEQLGGGGEGAGSCGGSGGCGCSGGR